MNSNDPNFFEEYNVEVRQDQEEWIDKLRELREQILSGNMESDFQINGQWVHRCNICDKPTCDYLLSLQAI